MVWSVVVTRVLCAEVDDVVSAVMCLLSDSAAMINGFTL